MATNTAMPVGQYVQYNPSPDNPRASAPSTVEQTYGIVRQAFTQQGRPYYQVVWDPAGMAPKVGTYHENELAAITPAQAQTIMQQIQAGTYQPNLPAQGSTYQDNIPQIALPPIVQGLGTTFQAQSPLGGSTVTQPSIIQSGAP